jgi:transposase InsO family protein
LYLYDRPTAYADEIAWYLFDCHHVEVSEATVYRLLREHKWTHKKAKKVATQRSDELRAHWQAKRLFWRQEQLVFVDESACAPRTGDRKYGWSPIGVDCVDTQRLQRTKRWSVLPAITMNGYLQDPLVIQGSVTQQLFEEWMRDKVLPQLHPGQIVVMDNATIHHSAEVKRMLQDAGVGLEYLPPYSSDLNPIEESFNALKLWVKRHIQMAPMFPDFGRFIVFAVSEASFEVDAVKYFESCGYEQ